MNNIEKVQEDIDIGVEYTTVDIPVRVTITSLFNSPFDFNSSIDEVGQIILTPVDKQVEFVEANTADNVEYETPIMEQPTEEITENNLTTKKMSINIKANMLAESDNLAVSADVDEIGQVVIYPMAKENSFISASIDDSLNLVTEELSQDYFGYTLKKDSDGWTLTTSSGEVLKQGIPTLPEAKIYISEHEIEQQKKLIEESTETDDAQETDNEEEQIPEISAEVINESRKELVYDFAEVHNDLAKITNKFKEEFGMIKCDTEEEQQICQEVMSQYYGLVQPLTTSANNYYVTYDKPRRKISEELDSSVIDRFMRQEIPLYSDTGKPLKYYEHVPQLDSEKLRYYYDKETDSMISYPVNNA